MRAGYESARIAAYTHNKTEMPWQLAIDGRACICVCVCGDLIYRFGCREFRHCLVNLLVRIPLLLLLAGAP